jgi:hypothetical protein
MATISRKKRKTRNPVCTTLRKLISSYGYGWGESGKVGRYSNDQLVRWYNTHGFMGSPSNGDLFSHFAGQHTLYFWADGRKSTNQTLSMVDIDCHHRGNAHSARAFADWLKDNGFPDLYHEPSTHGKGRHGYFVLFKKGFGDVATANVLEQLDKILKRLLRYFLATHPEHQVENVEVKGTPHVITWARGNTREIESMKSGALAKLPRDLFDRFEEFQNTTVLDFRDIHDLDKRASKLVIPALRKFSVFKAKGSTPDHPIRKDEIEAINGAYLEFARTWVEKPLATSSRAKVEAEDLAIGFGVVKFCTEKMNADGTLPTQRVKAIWDKMYENREVERAFDFHRWKSIRNLIEEHGGLEMEDRRYYTGFVNDQGIEIKGRAAKWRMASWFVERLVEVASQGYSDDELSENEEKEAEDVLNSSPDSSRGGPLLEQQDQDQFEESLPVNDRGGALLERVTGDTPEPSPDGEVKEEVIHELTPSPCEDGGGPLLEQSEDPYENDLFDTDWIIELQRSKALAVGLIWSGSIQNVWREAG